MKAMVHEEYGGPDVLELEEVEKPVPSGSELLIAVRAAGVNWADFSILTGIPYMVRLGFGISRPRAGIRGTDVAGVVEAVGAGVSGFDVGDEVFGWCKGAFAEFVSVPEDNLVGKPEGISFEQAAGVPMAALVALQALRDIGRVRPGQEVLINGASGGIGSFAVQIAKTMGAKVTGVCSTPNIEFVASLGADRVIDYTVDDFTEEDVIYDFILDIADNRPLAARRRVLAPTGTLVPNSGEGSRLAGSLGRIIRSRLLSMFTRQNLHPFLSRYDRDDLADVAQMIEQGDVEPVVGRTYPLAQAADALQYVGKRHGRGKTVITVRDT
jgi:NADPH:quinone reductase-like Zn-dependent oxidoreductase